MSSSSSIMLSFLISFVSTLFVIWGVGILYKNYKYKKQIKEFEKMDDRYEKKIKELEKNLGEYRIKEEYGMFIVERYGYKRLAFYGWEYPNWHTCDKYGEIHSFPHQPIESVLLPFNTLEEAREQVQSFKSLREAKKNAEENPAIYHKC